MSTFSLGEISSKLGTQMKAEEDKLGDMMANFDPDDPGAALQMEMEVQRYKAEISLQAALVKVVGDMDQMIFQKM